MRPNKAHTLVVQHVVYLFVFAFVDSAPGVSRDAGVSRDERENHTVRATGSRLTSKSGSADTRTGRTRTTPPLTPHRVYANHHARAPLPIRAAAQPRASHPSCRWHSHTHPSTLTLGVQCEPRARRRVRPNTPILSCILYFVVCIYSPSHSGQCHGLWVLRWRIPSCYYVLGAYIVILKLKT